MKRRFIFILFLIQQIFFNCDLISQVESNYHNRVINASGKSLLSPTAISINSALNTNEKSEFGIYVSPSLLGISELNYGTVYSNFSIANNFNSMLSMNGSSSDIFSEISPMAGLCYFEDKFSISILGKYTQFTIKDFNDESVFYLDIGSTVKIVDDIYCGFALTNITGAYLKGAEKNTHQTAALGIGTKFNNNLAVDINYILYVNYFGTLSFSTSYTIAEYFSAALAYQGNPGIFQLDMKFDLEKWSFPFSISYYDYFGISYSLGFALKL